MSQDRWEQVKELFGRAAELPEAERQAFVEAEAAGDEALVREVMALLEADQEDEFLERDEAQRSIVGQRFGDYVLLEELGSGGTGIVYRARQEGLDRDVALKVMPHHLASDRKRVERFQREAKAAAGLHHPGIAPIHDFGSHRDATGRHHYFSMDLVPGHDLARELELQAIGQGILPPGPGPEYQRAVAEVVRQCALALQHAHVAGVVHRDVKPNNIMLEPTGEPRLVDFGLARDERLGSITVTGQLQGTPYYMSPEQARALARPVDARTDIYSLGVVMYELLARCKPFTGRTSQEVIQKIAVREPEPLTRAAPGIARDLAVVCAKAMEKRPEDRYQSAAELAADLGRHLAGEPIAARPPGALRTAARRLRPYRLPLVAAAAALVALLGAWGVVELRAHLALPELQLEVAFADPDMDLAAAREAGALRVTATPLDPFSSAPLDAPRDLGSGALGGFRLAEGTWRISVAVGGYEPVELDRRITVGQEPPPLRARFLDAAERPDLIDLDAGEQPWGIPRTDPSAEMVQGLTRIGGSGDDATLDLGSYAVQPHEVSMGAFRAYLEESGDEAPHLWRKYDLSELPDDLPAVLVSFEEAQRFAEWYGLRLPFAPELEFATRGPEWHRFPWGDEEARGRANIYELEVRVQEESGPDLARFLRSAEPVTSRPEAATPAGLHHGLGNVSELTLSIAVVPGVGGEVPGLTLYGGDWSAARHREDLPALQVEEFGAKIGKIWVGFRCVRSR